MIFLQIADVLEDICVACILNLRGIMYISPVATVPHTQQASQWVSNNSSLPSASCNGLRMNETKYAMIGFRERDKNVLKKKHWIYFPRQIPVLFLVRLCTNQVCSCAVTNLLSKFSSGPSLLQEAFLDPFQQSGHYSTYCMYCSFCFVSISPLTVNIGPRTVLFVYHDTLTQ